MFERLIEWIKRIFGKKPMAKDADSENAEYTKAYEDIRKISFSAIFAHRLANKACCDSTITVTGINGTGNARAEFINTAVQRVWGKGKKITEQALGKGGKVIVPYIRNGKPYFDIVDQSRMVISAMDGDELTSVTILADSAIENEAVYYRMVDYTLENGVHTIKTRATNNCGSPVDLSSVPSWSDITEEISIQGVEHLLMAYLKSPIDNRKDKDIYGVPITFGSEQVIEALYTCMEDFAQEFELKKAFVGADEMLFGKDNKLPTNGLFKKFSGTGALNPKGVSFWEIFDPAIRDSSYKARYDMLCAQLEQSIGTSRGILTEQATTTATATEIKAANYDTFCLVDDIRAALEQVFRQLAYAYDVLAEAFGATPAGARGQYEVNFDWDMSMLESSSETFNQLSELESRGLIKGARLSSWVTGDSLEDAQKEIEEVKATTPTVKQLMGEPNAI